MYEVWLAAYKEDGKVKGGKKMGVAEAQTFEDACIQVMHAKRDWDKRNPTVYKGQCLVSSKREAMSFL